jgi:hypothetical protein
MNPLEVWNPRDVNLWPMKYSRWYGLLVFVLYCGWVLKLHVRHAPEWEQITILVLAVAVGCVLVADLRAKDLSSRKFVNLYTVLLCAVNIVLLFRI